MTLLDVQEMALSLVQTCRAEPWYADLLRSLRLEIDAELAAVYALLPYSTGDHGDRRGIEMPPRRKRTTEVESGNG